MKGRSLPRRGLPAAGAALTALVSLAGLTGLAGCSSADASEDRPRLKVTGAFMPQPVGDMASGFLTVTNSGGAPDRLTPVTSDVADDVTIHETVDRRMRLMSSAITSTVTSAVLVCAVVVLLFAAALIDLHAGNAIAVLFIAAMVTLAAGFFIFLIETRVAARAIRVRPSLLTHEADEAAGDEA